MATDDDAVGYQRPPRHSQFKPGQSGNPRGRKPGARGASQTLATVLNQKVKVTENGRRRSVTMLEVVTKQVVNKAAGGDIASSRLLFGMINSLGDKLFDTGTVVARADEEAIAQVMARFAGLDGGAK